MRLGKADPYRCWLLAAGVAGFLAGCGVDAGPEAGPPDLSEYELLFWASAPSSSFAGLFTSRADGSERRAHGSSRCAAGASWSPDGERIAFSLSGGPQCSSGVGIQTIASSGTDQRIVTVPEGAVGYFTYDSSPDWSPDGSLIVFQRQYAWAGGTVPPSGIFVIRPDGTGERRVATGLYFGPRWSPDGLRIAYAGVDHGRATGSDRSIWVVNADGSGTLRLTDPGPSGVVRDYTPEWVSNERVRFRRELAYYAVNADGTGLTELTRPQDYGTLSPDGDWIVYVEVRGGVWALTVARADGSEPRPIGDGFLPRWRPR